jgi:hypothetical protein
MYITMTNSFDVKSLSFILFYFPVLRDMTSFLRPMAQSTIDKDQIVQDVIMKELGK